VVACVERYVRSTLVQGRYSARVSETISQRELRNENAAVMRRVEQGESFTITRNGRPVADLVPRPAETARRRPWAEVQQRLVALPPMDVERWYAERAEADELLGSDDILDQ